MRVPSCLQRLFTRDAGEPRDAVASLLVAAREDPTLHRQLLALLRAPALQRASILGTARHEMELRGEPAAYCAALAVLASDEGARLALQALGASLPTGELKRD